MFGWNIILGTREICDFEKANKFVFCSIFALNINMGMIRSIFIQNYKNLSGLHIPEFSRVNLISGKNNTGKSSLLEALSLHVSNSALIPILETRGEIVKRPFEDAVDQFKQNFDAISSLFTGRSIGVGGACSISIDDGNYTMAIRFVRYVEQMTDEDGFTVNKRIVLSSQDDSMVGDYHLALEFDRGGQSRVLVPLERRLHVPETDGRTNRSDMGKCVMVAPNYDVNTPKFWDRIALTDKENYVIRALKIIEPGIESVAFLEPPTKYGNRYPVVKVSGINARLPLRSMGDGINHILSIVLALVNCENGCVLIDEIDNGLHYTVQRMLWTIIFDLATILNVQVFATTHSSDCISSFGKVLGTGDNVANGRYIRLENNDGVIRSVEYNLDELNIVAAQNIEIR